MLSLYATRLGLKGCCVLFVDDICSIYHDQLKIAVQGAEVLLIRFIVLNKDEKNISVSYDNQAPTKLPSSARRSGETLQKSLPVNCLPPLPRLTFEDDTLTKRTCLLFALQILNTLHLARYGRRRAAPAPNHELNANPFNRFTASSPCPTLT